MTKNIVCAWCGWRDAIRLDEEKHPICGVCGSTVNVQSPTGPAKGTPLCYRIATWLENNAGATCEEIISGCGWMSSRSGVARLLRHAVLIGIVSHDDGGQTQRKYYATGNPRRRMAR